MNIDLYQQEAHKTGTTYLNSSSVMYQVYPLLGLVGEGGEFLAKICEFTDKIKKFLRNNEEPVEASEVWDMLIRNPDAMRSIQLELGDIAWYWCELHTRLGLKPSETLAMNIEKIRDRANRNVIRSEGDNR